MPVVNAGLLLAAIFDILPFSFFTLSFLFSLGIVGSFTKRINNIHNIIGKKVALLLLMKSCFIWL